MIDERTKPVVLAKRFCLLAALAAVASACGSGAGEATTTELSPSEMATVDSRSVPEWEEFKAASLSEVRGKQVYVVESDIVLDDEDALWNFYADLYLDTTDKSIVNTVDDKYDVRTTPTAIRYCFADNWGVSNCPTPSTCYTAPALAGVKTSIQDAMDAWERHANLTFIHESGFDGATCSTSGSNPGVDFVVQHYGATSTAKGPFPSNSWATQELLVPTGGISRLLAIHEVGHAIGLRHEHIHDDAKPGCKESKNFGELAEFDKHSSMKYGDCTDNSNINGTEISKLDGVGVRILYGAPARWFPAYTALLR